MVPDRSVNKVIMKLTVHEPQRPSQTVGTWRTTPVFNDSTLKNNYEQRTCSSFYHLTHRGSDEPGCPPSPPLHCLGLNVLLSALEPVFSLRRRARRASPPTSGASGALAAHVEVHRQPVNEDTRRLTDRGSARGRVVSRLV